MTTATRYKELNESYLQTLSSNAYHDGAAGTIRDAVWAALQGDTNTDVNRGLIDAAKKLTHDAMGLLDATIGLIHNDWLDSKCDWHRIDGFFDKKSDCLEKLWVINQLEEQSYRIEKIHAEFGPATGRGLATASTFLQAAFLLLNEVDDD